MKTARKTAITTTVAATMGILRKRVLKGPTNTPLAKAMVRPNTVIRMEFCRVSKRKTSIM
jgi:isocitrate dehydrogenase